MDCQETAGACLCVSWAAEQPAALCIVSRAAGRTLNSQPTALCVVTRQSVLCSGAWSHPHALHKQDAHAPVDAPVTRGRAPLRLAAAAEAAAEAADADARRAAAEADRLRSAFCAYRAARAAEVAALEARLHALLGGGAAAAPARRPAPAGAAAPAAGAPRARGAAPRVPRALVALGARPALVQSWDRLLHDARERRSVQSL